MTLVNPRSISVVVVARDNASTLEGAVERLLRALTITIEEFEILIVDDGSTDNTFEICQKIRENSDNIKITRNGHPRGAGSAYMAAVKDNITKSFVTYIPGNNTWPYRSFLELFGNLGKADVITSYPNNMLSQMPPIDRIISRSYTLLINLLFGKKLAYYNGLTIYPADFLREARIGTRGFGFQAEALLKAVFAGYSFLEMPLPVDQQAVRRTRAATPNNILSAVGTLLRTMYELHIVKRHPIPSRDHRIIGFGQGQSIDELGFQRERPTDAKTEAPRTNTSQKLTIVVTGASSGIGAELCKSLADDGHNLFACARRQDKLAQVAAACGAQVCICDVADASQVANFSQFVAQRTKHVDVLINCAGSFGAIGPIETSDPKAWWHTMEVNLLGTYLTIKEFLPLLKNSASPRIINFSGGGAFSAFPNYSAYACSKAAVVRLTECLASELLSDGISVNAVAPGIVATEVHEATLAAGEEKAGRMQYLRTQAVLRDGGAPMENVLNCIRALTSPQMSELTGKTISSNFDPWATPAFKAHVADITRSDLYSLRRINVVNLPEGFLRRNLLKAWTGGNEN